MLHDFVGYRIRSLDKLFLHYFLCTRCASFSSSFTICFTSALILSCNFIVSSPAYGSWSVYLRSGEQSSAKIEYSAFLYDKIEARVDNDGYLYLKVRRSIGITRDDLKAFVTIPKIEYIKASGASHIHSEGIFEGKTNKIEQKAE